MSDLQDKTQKLKKLIDPEKQNAKRAWDAGNLLLPIFQKEEYKPNYQSFSDYTLAEFKVSEDTARKYISIFKAFPKNLITNKMAISHLHALLNVEQTMRNCLLNVMCQLEKDNNDSKYPPYTEKSLINVKRLLSSVKSDKKLSKEEIKELLQQEVSKMSVGRKEDDKINFRMGPPLKAVHFPELVELYTSEPIDEQGFVGLFCTMFPLMKEKDLKFKFGKYLIKFSKILCIRTPFPDAKMEFLIDSKKNVITQLDIEFEFNSYSYRDHLKSKKKCDLIICWKHDWEDQRFIRPPILSIKDVLETGIITLHD